MTSVIERDAVRPVSAPAEAEDPVDIYARQIDFTLRAANNAMSHSVDVWRAFSRFYADAFDANRHAFGEFLIAWHAHLLQRKTDGIER